tara:strand:- start:6777 stop:7919 length:1143 start_codon:yes stop_codon:yes gene_type:complete
MKKIGILGSTGSVGTQCLDLIRDYPDEFKVDFLVAHSNIEKIITQAKDFNPKYVCLFDESKYEELKNELPGIQVLIGNDEIHSLCKNQDLDIILNAVSGYKGLSLSYEILKSGIDLALSNKESIVQAGSILINLAKENDVNIFPVDSEHSAIWQCLIGEKNSQIKRIILTGSGGPFRTLDLDEFQNITKDQALNHPNWDMGPKITIDSATMMNKGFELIEAFWLFGVSYDNIDVVIHPQSIIHSMIEYVDGSIKAQLSEPTMRTPIQFALSYPDRLIVNQNKFDFIKNNQFTFEDVDYQKFPCLKLAYESGIKGGTCTTVLNVANDLAVDMFLNNKINFTEINNIIDICLNKHDNISNPDLDNIYGTMRWTEEYILKELT